MPDLAGLIERVRAATGADRSLDLAIGGALLNWGDTPAGEEPPPGRPEYSQPDGHFTASLDAALALVERVAPEWAVSVTRYRQTGLGEAWLWQNWDGYREHRERATTPALALIAALLAALNQTETEA